MTVKEKIRLPRAAYPEKVGVSSAEIEALIRDFHESDIEVHSLMILSHGEVAFESWAAPYSPEHPHAMYSVSKSFTSAAVGFAIEEGLITLDSKVIDVFPEYRPEHLDENLEKLRVEHLLSMQSGKDVSVFADKAKQQWIKDFFDSAWKFSPGDGNWQYVNENQYMLCAMLTRITGMSVTEYLTPRLFEPLGIDVPVWEKDNNSIEAGGWGLYLTTEDLAKFTDCYQHGGKFMGKQVIPELWAKESGKVQSLNACANKTPDGSAGYGYCFWRNAPVKGYRSDGMFSQFGMVFEDYDASLIITAGEIDEQKTRNCIWRHIPKCFIAPDSEPKADHNIALSPLPDNLPVSVRYEKTEKEIDGKSISFPRNRLLNAVGFPVSMLPIPVVYMSEDKCGNIDDVVFTFDESTCTMTWDENGVKNTIVCGMDGAARTAKIRLSGIDFTAYSTAAWENETTLNVHMRPIESVCQRRLKFEFKSNNTVTMLPSCQPPTTAMVDNLAEDMDNYFKSPLLQKLGYIIFDKLPKIAEPLHTGKIKEV